MKVFLNLEGLRAFPLDTHEKVLAQINGIEIKVIDRTDMVPGKDIIVIQLDRPFSHLFIQSHLVEQWRPAYKERV